MILIKYMLFGLPELDTMGTGPWHHPHRGGRQSFYEVKLPAKHETMDPDAEEGQLDSISPRDHPHSSKETQGCSIRPVTVPQEPGIPMCSGAGGGGGTKLSRHGLEADSVPRLGRGTKVAEMWATGTEFRELAVWWDKTWIPTIRRNI